MHRIASDRAMSGLSPISDVDREWYEPAPMKDLVDFDPGCLDDSLPLFGILFQKPREFSRRGTLNCVRVACKLLDDSRIGESFSNITTYFLHDFRRCFGWRKDALPPVSYVASERPTPRRSAHPALSKIVWCRSMQGHELGQTENM